MATLADALRQTGYAQDGTLATPTPTQYPMNDALATYLRNTADKFNENQANQMAALQRAFPDNTLANADPHAMAEYAMQVPLTGMMVGPQSALWNAENAFNASKLMKQGVPAEDDEEGAQGLHRIPGHAAACRRYRQTARKRCAAGAFQDPLKGFRACRAGHFPVD